MKYAKALYFTARIRGMNKLIEDQQTYSNKLLRDG